MSTKEPRSPDFIIDTNGDPVVKVPLAKGKGYATVGKDDWERLEELGMTGQWHFNSNGHGGFYVRCVVNERKVCVARYILEAGSGERVYYKSYDTRDLRRSNLFIGTGKAEYAGLILEKKPSRKEKM